MVIKWTGFWLALLCAIFMLVMVVLVIIAAAGGMFLGHDLAGGSMIAAGAWCITGCIMFYFGNKYEL